MYIYVAIKEYTEIHKRTERDVMDRTYKFRLYPTKTQKKELNTHRWLAKNLWNELLQYSKGTYEKTGKFSTRADLQKHTKNKGMYSQSAQEISHRVQDATIRYFRLKKQGKKVGFPRFKNLDRMKSIHYPQGGFWIKGNKVKITPFGEMHIVLHREMQSKIKTLSLKRESSGKWYAIFVAELPDIEFRSNDRGKVGMDLGLKTFATLSNGTKIKNPRTLDNYLERLSHYQKELSNKRRGGSNRYKAKLKVGRLHEKIQNIRTDFLHKTSTKLVNSYSMVALEKLQPQDMAEQRYGRQINDASWGAFASMLAYKAESAGCQIVFVNPKDTSKTCHVCGNVQKMPLNERTYICDACGQSLDRDINASINILAKATVGQTGSNACGDRKFLSLKQEAHTF